MKITHRLGRLEAALGIGPQADSIDMVALIRELDSPMMERLVALANDHQCFDLGALLPEISDADLERLEAIAIEAEAMRLATE